MTQYERLAEPPVETNITLCEGLFVKHAVFAAGTHIAQHSHESDHLSIIASGAVRACRAAAGADTAWRRDRHRPSPGAAGGAGAHRHGQRRRVQRLYDPRHQRPGARCGAR